MLWDKAKMMWLVADGQQRKSVELHGFQCFLQNACKTVIMKNESLYLASYGKKQYRMAYDSQIEFCNKP